MRWPFEPLPATPAEASVVLDALRACPWTAGLPARRALLAAVEEGAADRPGGARLALKHGLAPEGVASLLERIAALTEDEARSVIVAAAALNQYRGMNAVTRAVAAFHSREGGPPACRGPARAAVDGSIDTESAPR